ncbi:MAG: MoxR family ATPase [Actinobacteria bacterium]|nr:MoxR family ATPase [Actinomycetota bacterium]
MRPSSDTGSGIRGSGPAEEIDRRTGPDGDARAAGDGRPHVRTDGAVRTGADDGAVLTDAAVPGTGGRTQADGQPPLTAGEAEEIASRAGLVARNIASVILGKEHVIRSCVIALLAGGHLIVEDYPGVGKTLLAKALARSVGGRFSRIQFTPDLLPSDVTGVNVFDQHSTRFEFRPGPVFANVVLADEINRASPKTQASLLECMEEGQATVDNVAHRIAPPFMIVATQNPVEYEGTYPLPEAQLDRFMMRISLGYPAVEAEESILDSQTSGDPFAALQPVMQAADVLALQQAVLRVRVAPAIRRYVVDLVAATRDHPEIYLGASPRAGIALLRAAKASAVLSGRDYVVPQDVKQLAARVLAHRIILSTDMSGGAEIAEAVIGRVLEHVPAPGPGR